MRFAPLLLLSACYLDPAVPFDVAPGNYCASKCGMEAHGLNESCTEFDALEAKLLAAYAAVVTPDLACLALHGVQVYILPHETLSPPGTAPELTEYGRYYYKSQTIWLTDHPLVQGSFSHEAGHVFDYAYTPDVAGKGHFEWVERGFTPAALAFKAP